MVLAKQTSQGGWVLFVLGALLFPVIIGIPIWAIGCYLLWFEKKYANECVSCRYSEAVPRR